MLKANDSSLTLKQRLTLTTHMMDTAVIYASHYTGKTSKSQPLNQSFKHLFLIITKFILKSCYKWGFEHFFDVITHIYAIGKMRAKKSWATMPIVDV